MMNYSDYDSDGYSSNEDADYVPSGEYCLTFCEARRPLAFETLNHEKNLNSSDIYSNQKWGKQC